MSRNNQTLTKISFRQKTALIIFGAFLTVIILETGLRLGGFVLLSIQERRNRISISRKGSYRIMCLGESTTVRQYPPFLEEILKQRNIGVKFSVIDKGFGGSTTAGILAQLGPNLDEYHPNMVITMMGINDGGLHMPYEVPTDSKSTLFFRSFRTYKLARLLWLHVISKIKETGLYKSPQEREPIKGAQSHLLVIGSKKAYVEIQDSISREDASNKAVKLDHSHDEETYLKVGWSYLEQDRFSHAEEAFNKAIELNLQSEGGYFGLGQSYQEKEKYSRAEEMYNKVVKLNPQNKGAYLGLGVIYLEQGKFSQAEEVLNKAVELDPQSESIYTELGGLYCHQGRFSLAEEAYRKAVELNPRDEGVYWRLAEFYRDQGQLSQAEEAYNAFVALKNPMHEGARETAYRELGLLYYRQNKISQAEEAYLKAVTVNPQSDLAAGILSLFYQGIGKPGLAQEYSKKKEAVRLGFYNPRTFDNYHRLKKILDARGIQLVCVQYPMRSVGPLKKIFKGNEQGIIFVDNEKIFKDALKKTDYKEYFADMFGGDFGHCTPKGNKLLAQNIANTILKEIFNK